MSKDPIPPRRETTLAVLRLFEKRGGSQYGGEAVSQLEHALQAAHIAESTGLSASLIVAALLHDVGHLLHQLPEDAPDQGVDDRHEMLGAAWLGQRFSPAVVEPVKLHVPAKRYLCALDPSYLQELSPPSVQSLQLQGGPMTPQEMREFDRHPFFREAVQLRQIDDVAKIPGYVTPGLEHFARFVDAAAGEFEEAIQCRERR